MIEIEENLKTVEIKEKRKPYPTDSVASVKLVDGVLYVRMAYNNRYDRVYRVEI